MKFAVALIVLLITVSVTRSTATTSEPLIREPSEKASISSTISSGLTAISVRGWKESALERAENKLHALEKELRKVKAVHKCNTKKSNMLRTLYKKRKSNKCVNHKERNTNGCHKMNDLRKQVNEGKRMCRRNMSCKKKYVWPLQWKLKQLIKSCDCKEGAEILKMIWKTKKIRCGKSRKAWRVKRDMRNMKKRIVYLEKSMVVIPSVAPRPSREYLVH